MTRRKSDQTDEFEELWARWSRRTSRVWLLVQADHWLLLSAGCFSVLVTGCFSFLDHWLFLSAGCFSMLTASQCWLLLSADHWLLLSAGLSDLLEAVESEHRRLFLLVAVILALIRVCRCHAPRAAATFVCAHFVHWQVLESAEELWAVLQADDSGSARAALAALPGCWQTLADLFTFAR